MVEHRKAAPAIIAVCGKGGTGKTSIGAGLVRLLMEKENARVLAIDADPAIGLASALGIKAGKTVDDIRNDLIRRIGSGETGPISETMARLDYQVFEALQERENLAFLAIGRPETEGCYCKVNSLLKEIIDALVENFDYVVIDGEAGIEQVNRRVMNRVTHLLLISDATQKGINVIRNLHAVAQKAIRFEKSGLILNRLRSEAEARRLPLPETFPLLGSIPEDETIREFDLDGKSILDLPEGPFLSSLRHCLKALGVH